MQITHIPPEKIEISPVLEAIPLAPAEVADPIIADVAARGIDVPLIVNSPARPSAGSPVQYELLDGRIRLRGALAAGLPSVPCIVREDGDAMAATIILASLCQRKHYTKSTLAYIAFPLLEDAWREAKDQRIEFLKSGGKDHSAQNALCSAEAVAHSIGLSRRLLFYAQSVHALCEKHEGAREKFEPLILSGEISLGEAIQGINGWVSTKGKEKPQSQQLELFRSLWKSISFRFGTVFTRLSEREQAKVADEFAATIETLPEKVLEAAERKIRQLKKERQLANA